MSAMQPMDCNDLEQAAEELAKVGKNLEAMKRFSIAAECWTKWESYSKAAQAYERAYEHGMLACEYAEAALVMTMASALWIRHGEHDKSEMNCQIAAEAYVSAAGAEKNPLYFLEAAYCSITGGDIDMARSLLHAVIETTKGEVTSLIDLALMLTEYRFGDADKMLRDVLADELDREHYSKMERAFELVLAGFIRTSLESETVISLSSLAESTGIEDTRLKHIVTGAIKKGFIPAYYDQDSDELVIDSDRIDVSTLEKRKGPILSRDIDDPGAWDIDLDEN